MPAKIPVSALATTRYMPGGWFAWIAEAKQRRRGGAPVHGGAGAIHILGPRPLSEIGQFVKEKPMVADELGFKPDPEPVRVFDPGKTSYPSLSGGVSFSPDEWRRWLDAHTSLDFGVYMHEEAVVEKNLEAIASRSGTVWSRYELNDEEQGRFDRVPIGYMPRQTRVVDVVTAFGRPNETLMFVETLGHGWENPPAVPEPVVAPVLEPAPVVAPVDLPTPEQVSGTYLGHALRYAAAYPPKRERATP